MCYIFVEKPALLAQEASLTVEQWTKGRKLLQVPLIWSKTFLSLKVLIVLFCQAGFWSLSCLIFRVSRDVDGGGKGFTDTGATNIGKPSESIFKRTL